MKTTGILRVSSPANPIIVFEEETLSKVLYLVKTHPIECQWWHSVDRLERSEGIIYYLHDLFIPEQWVGSTDVESDPEMIAAMWQLVMKEREIKKLKDLNPLIQKTTAWCHSHHNMGVTPSGTDDTQWKEQKEMASGQNADAPQVMLIVNKQGHCFNRIWDPVLGIEFENVGIAIQQPETYSDIDEIIESRFKKKKATANISQVKTHTSITYPITSNGHKQPCTCKECKTATHTANCPCWRCKDKNKKK